MSNSDQPNHWEELAKLLGAEAATPRVEKPSGKSRHNEPEPPAVRTSSAVYHYERPKSDWNQLADKLGLDAPPPPPRPAAPVPSAPAAETPPSPAAEPQIERPREDRTRRDRGRSSESRRDERRRERTPQEEAHAEPSPSPAKNEDFTLDEGYDIAPPKEPSADREAAEGGEPRRRRRRRGGRDRGRREDKPREAKGSEDGRAAQERSRDNEREGRSRRERGGSGDRERRGRRDAPPRSEEPIHGRAAPADDELRFESEGHEVDGGDFERYDFDDTFDLDAEPVERAEAAESPTDQERPSEEEAESRREDGGRRRRRRRRGGRRDAEPRSRRQDESRRERPESDDDAVIESALDFDAEPNGEAVQGEGDRHSDARDRSSFDEPVADEEGESDEAHPVHRGVPTWDEAMAMIVGANMEARAKNPHAGGSGAPRGRGRGGRGRKRGGPGRRS